MFSICAWGLCDKLLGKKRDWRNKWDWLRLPVSSCLPLFIDVSSSSFCSHFFAAHRPLLTLLIRRVGRTQVAAQHFIRHTRLLSLFLTLFLSLSLAHTLRNLYDKLPTERTENTQRRFWFIVSLASQQLACSLTQLLAHTPIHSATHSLIHSFRPSFDLSASHTASDSLSQSFMACGGIQRQWQNMHFQKKGNAREKYVKM